MHLISMFLGAAATAFAANAANFTIDPSQSTVTLSGSVSGIVLTQQGPGSLTSRIEGSLQADTTGGEVEITGGTLDVQNNGTWQPGVGGTAGAAPADFGAQGSSFFGTVYGALRNIVMNATSPPQQLTGEQFDASAITFSFPQDSTATLDYNAGFAGTGSEPLAGATTNKTATVGRVTGAAGSQVITIAVDATFVFSVLGQNDTELTVTGQIVAREGGVTPQPDGPRFSDIDVVNNQVRLTVDEASATARLESSTNLVNWATKQAEVATVDADTRTFTVPVTGPKEFYRLVDSAPAQP